MVGIGDGGIGGDERRCTCCGKDTNGGGKGTKVNEFVI